MTKSQLDKLLKRIVKEIVEGLKSEIGDYAESITLVGSYAIGKISYQRPNINILVFLKPNHPAKAHLSIGKDLGHLQGVSGGVSGD